MKSEQFGEFIRDKFVVHNAWLLRDENGKKNFEKLSKFHKNDIKIEKFLTFDKRYIKFLNFLIVNKL